MIDVQPEVASAFDVQAIRLDFPILHQETHGYPFVYLDSAATSQKPTAVIGALDDYFRRYNANIHRGIYQISEEATAAYEGARRKVAALINARSAKECIFVRNTTEAINLVAHSWGRANLREGDEIVLTEMEHHSNLVPWQMLAHEKGARLKFIPFDEHGMLRLEALDTLLTGRTKLVSIVHMSNALGTINPVKEMARRAHEVGAVIVVDGAQSVPHLPVDVQDLDCDFLAFSGHKMCGPTGIGVLYGKRRLLEAMPPFLGGGSMIKQVRLQESTWNDVPWKFEAGTPSIAEGIGLGVAVDYISTLGLDAIRAHEQALVRYALARLCEVPDLQIYGPPAERRGGAVAMSFPDIHAHDVAAVLDRCGIAVRAGHHCTMPLHEKLGVPATFRASFYIYNVPQEIDRLVEGLYHCRKVFV